MALPQQGTETEDSSCCSFSICVNGLTPTGDGNYKKEYFYKKNKGVLMALPQQGTETLFPVQGIASTGSVNGLTPTGDGNEHPGIPGAPVLRVNGLTPTGDGNKEVTIMGDIVVLG